jgi:hypothetical protein
MAPSFKDPGPVSFAAVIQAHEGGGAYVEFPRDVEKLYGAKGRVPVRVSFEGEVYRGSMVRMGTPRHILLILKDIREKLGKGPGDRIRVTVELDQAPRTVELAPDVEAAFKKAGVLARYRAMSFSHQREWARHIEEAKQSDTRGRRIARAVQEIGTKKTPAGQRT